jgi:hypothetical protein
MQSACAVLYCNVSPIWLYNIFSHYLTNGTIFGKNVLNIKSVFWFSLQLLSETFLILRRTERDIIIYVHRSSCKVPGILVRFQRNLNFLDRSSKNTRISNSMETRPVGAELFHADGQTGMTTLILVFSNFANAPKNILIEYAAPLLIGKGGGCNTDKSVDRNTSQLLHCFR